MVKKSTNSGAVGANAGAGGSNTGASGAISGAKVVKSKKIKTTNIPKTTSARVLPLTLVNPPLARNLRALQAIAAICAYQRIYNEKTTTLKLIEDRLALYTHGPPPVDTVTGREVLRDVNKPITEGLFWEMVNPRTTNERFKHVWDGDKLNALLLLPGIVKHRAQAVPKAHRSCQWRQASPHGEKDHSREEEALVS